MEKSEAITKVPEKLVENMPLASLDILAPKTSSTKKRIRRITDPYIRRKMVNGYPYYYFVRGEREIYLGSAVSILKAITGRGK
jgi:hypothetical protein